MICPKCKADIDNDSCYCDQCGQEIRYCQTCRKPGKGNRCTACGGRMVPATEYILPTGEGNIHIPQPTASNASAIVSGADVATIKAPTTVRLILSNGLLGLTIEGVDGAVIGRRNGIYQNLFANFPYVSGSHAQLRFDANKNRWTVTDMHSSNGSRYNNIPLLPGEPCTLENGSTLQLANVVLNVAIL